MKYKVRISNRSYEVEIEDIHAKPIIARVDGQRFEVQPENRNMPEDLPEAKEVAISEMPKPSAVQIGNTNELTAPLPGTIIEIFVREGDQVEVGNVMLVIEAMKMKNSIRSTRTGRVVEVLVRAGETVAHKQTLVRFE